MSDTQKENLSAINIVFVGFIVSSILLGAWTGKMQIVTDESFAAAKSAVELSISLIGVMALWLGLVRILEAGGLMYSLARGVKPLMSKLFPDVPPEHPAMSAMVLNMSANMLGLGNAATPLGIKAMTELNRLNPFPGTATNAMCLFLAINTSSVTLLPLGVIGVRAAAGAAQPASIFLPSLLATTISTIVGVSIALWLARRDGAYLKRFSEKFADVDGGIEGSEGEREEVIQDEVDAELCPPNSPQYKLLSLAFFILFLGALLRATLEADNKFSFFANEVTSLWLMPALMLGIVLYGLSRGVKVYEAVTEGAKQGFEIAIKIIPFLVAILVAIGMFRASGAMELLAHWLGPITGMLYMPAEVLPMALIRPLSGSGAFGIMSELVNRSPDSYSSYLVSTMQGSTETTFYVLAVYFGSVGITRIRHALVAAICADVSGIVASCLLCRYFWTGA